MVMFKIIRCDTFEQLEKAMNEFAKDPTIRIISANHSFFVGTRFHVATASGLIMYEKVNTSSQN